MTFGTILQGVFLMQVCLHTRFLTFLQFLVQKIEKRFSNQEFPLRKCDSNHVISQMTRDGEEIGTVAIHQDKS